ncbi:MAG: purine-nucleoside phosphorylase [Isosphaeraceae bacterium]|nr:purine-nucleoside phosphorylase [Isosphaeraceae bacterium]
MIPTDLHERATEAAVFIQESVPDFPRIAVVLGSGLGGFAESLADTVVVPYALIPHFPTPTVAGHRGNLVVGRLGAARVAALQGRFHAYEGYDLLEVTFPIRVLQVLGVKTLILTAATGGIRDSLWPGAIVCLSDHLNLIGANPLRGPNDERLGPRFPDLSEVYSRRLRDLACEEAMRLHIPLSAGVYACMPGPSYETPAEIRMLRTLGADVVGMSTVPEAIVARHGGMEVLAFAIVSNWAAGIAGTPITHEEVLEAGRVVGPRLAALIGRVVERLAAEEARAPGPA